MHVDGSLSANWLGVELIPTSPKEDVIRHALHFGFPSTNNEVEYEVLTASLKISKKLGVQHLKAYSNSRLIVNHVLNEYEAREENMKKCLQKVMDLMQAFQSFDIQQISKVENTQADTMSKLAASSLHNLCM